MGAISSCRSESEFFRFLIPESGKTKLPKKQKDKKDEQRIAGAKPSHKLAEFAGEYEHPGYGMINITLENKKLHVQFNSFSSPLQRWHYDSFRISEDIFARVEY